MEGGHPEFTALVDDESVWLQYQPFLEERGYMLRPRYRPGWVPEMLTPGKIPSECEDTIRFKGPVLDATRISDGAQVVLKIVRSGSMEVHISELLARHPDAEKHAIPVLEIIPMADDAKWAFIVMPRMRVCNRKPNFQTVREFAEFLQQILEALVFLHSQNIAHRDICPNNIVVDASRMIPGGFHFVKDNTSDGVHPLQPSTTGISSGTTPPCIMHTRTAAGPLHYYLIDFGLSTWFPSYATRAHVTGYFGQRAKRIPELSRTIPYDAFKIDMRLVGEMLRKDFLHARLDFVVPLARRLLRDDPARRPDAGRALAQFRRIVAKMDEAGEMDRPIARSVNLRERRLELFVRGFV
ncbi:kinase-like domain-containing protein [Mycena filopes]|nr:kinase-like domain-containing protein [Mycena filopes]